MFDETMTGWEAIKLDNKFDVEFDEDTDDYIIVGCKSGFCYESYSSWDDALEALEARTQLKMQAAANDVVPVTTQGP